MIAAAVSWLRVALSRSVVLLALRTSAVVGTTLNLVNQGSALWHDWGAISWPRLLLNYVVPYLVATYGATSALRRRARSERA